MNGWDEASGIRERLALLAERGGRLGFEPRDWAYHPSRDYWYYCGSDVLHQQGTTVTIKTEGSASLDAIHTRLGFDRKTAMALIGHPERDRP